MIPSPNHLNTSTALENVVGKCKDTSNSTQRTWYWWLYWRAWKCGKALVTRAVYWYSILFYSELNHDVASRTLSTSMQLWLILETQQNMRNWLTQLYQKIQSSCSWRHQNPVQFQLVLVNVFKIDFLYFDNLWLLAGNSPKNSVHQK